MLPYIKDTVQRLESTVHAGKAGQRELEEVQYDQVRLVKENWRWRCLHETLFVVQWVQSLSGEVAARERVGHGPCAFSQLFLKGKVKSTPISGATSGAFFVTPKPLLSFSTTFLLREYCTSPIICASP